MSDFSPLEQQQIIDNFIEFTDYTIWENVSRSFTLRDLFRIRKRLQELPNSVEPLDISEIFCNLKDILCYYLKYFGETQAKSLETGSDLLVKLLAKSPDEDKAVLCQIWHYSRASYIESLLRVHRWMFPFDIEDISTLYYGFTVALKFGHLDWLEKFAIEFENIDYHQSFYGSSRLVANAFFDKDIEIRQAARLFSQRLPPNQKQPILEASLQSLSCYDLSHIQFLAEQEFYSAVNLKAAVMVALVQGSFFARFEESFAVIRVLVKLVADSELAPQAEAVLRNLCTEEGQSRLCSLFLFEENNHAEKLAVELGYLPLNPALKAAFFFLSRQFAKYDDFDFDHSQLRSFCETAPVALCRRVAQAVRQSGNPAYLDILSPKHGGSELKVSASQTKAVVEVLVATANWTALWQKALELPFMGSVAALGKLLKSGWQPSTPEENALYQKLTVLLRSNIAATYRLETGLPAEARKLLEQPFSSATMQDCTTLNLLTENLADAASPVQNLLAYACAILNFRFRHAIEIETGREIEPTKTDIEL